MYILYINGSILAFTISYTVSLKIKKIKNLLNINLLKI